LKPIGNKTESGTATKANAARFKRKFDSLLRHIKLILINYRNILSNEEWLNLIHETRESIKFHPEEYLGPDLPSREIVCDAIDLVFDGFRHDIHLRKVQAFRKHD
jgi:hypothetical protein